MRGGQKGAGVCGPGQLQELGTQRGKGELRASGLPRSGATGGQPWSVGVLGRAGARHLYTVIRMGSTNWGSSSLSSISSAMEASCMAK